MPKQLVAFRYYGGKYYQLRWLLSLLPKCHHFCEPFCGAASVVLNREPSKVETINDANGDIANFFRVLRDNSDQLIGRLQLTPYARDAFVDAINYDGDDPIERARCFYIIIHFGYSSRIINVRECDWGYVKKKPGGRYPPLNTIRAVDKLPDIVNRLRYIQIDNRPAVDVIKRNDAVGTLFYCDPPYVQDTCDANFGDYSMDDKDHRQLAKVLHNVKGQVAISGHQCGLYDELYGDWQRHDKDCYVTAGNKAKMTSRRRVDSLWTNYQIDNPLI